MTEANPYKNFLSSIIWHVKRFGIIGVARGVLRRVFAPIIIWTLDKEYFEFKGEKIEYLYHRYNATWKNERCIEVPLVKSITDKEKGEILEIGNVLFHYYKSKYDVLDKFEKGKKIINADIVSFKPEKKYNLIISVSTFEHIGFDDDLSGFKSSADKIEKSFINTFKNALKKDGKIVVSAPIGYNPDMDKLIFSNKLKFDEQYFYKKISNKKWTQVKRESAIGTKYNSPYLYANCIFLGIKKKR